MDIETSRDIITNLIKLKNIDRDSIVDLLLGYIINGYDLENITKSILGCNANKSMKG